MDPIPEAIYIRTNDVTVVHQSQLHKNVGCTGYPGLLKRSDIRQNISRDLKFVYTGKRKSAVAYSYLYWKAQ